MRVLVMDGGGSKGLFTLEVLRYIEIACGRPIRECFDLIVGTSIGAFIAACIVAGKSIDQMEEQFNRLVTSIANAHPTVRSMLTRLIWGHVLDAGSMEEILRELFGETTMADLPEFPHVLLLAGDAREFIPHPFLIRNRPVPADRSPFASSTTMRMVDAVRAASAAPTVYPAHVVDGIPLVDAAILANNPVLFALAEANLLSTEVDCIVSIGTGVETRVAHPSPHRGLLEWMWTAVRRTVDPMTSEMLIRGILPPSKYVRFDPPTVGDCSAWEGDTKTLFRWRKVVQEYMHEEQETLASLVHRLFPLVQHNEDRSIPNGGGPECPVSRRPVSE